MQTTPSAVTGTARAQLVVAVPSHVNVLRHVLVQIFIQIQSLRRAQAAALDVVERLAPIGTVQSLEVKESHVLAAEQSLEEAVLPPRSGHVEHSAGQRSEKRVLS